jgi:tryptophan synthase alpha subunit
MSKKHSLQSTETTSQQSNGSISSPMINSIDAALLRIKQRGTIGLMTHMVVGYPSLEEAVPLAQALEVGGSDLLEVQIPFSDPIADGPTIMAACDHALAQGVTTISALETIAEIVSQRSIPVLIMAYYNTIFAYGTAAFIKKAAEIGVSGLIVPDIPPEEESHEQFITQCEACGIHAIRVVSPASTLNRLAINAALARGFVYTSSRYGVTGSQTELDSRLHEYLDRLQQVFAVPVAVGFGIRRKEQVQALVGHADVAVVGSAILEKIREQGVGAVQSYVQSLL